MRYMDADPYRRKLHYRAHHRGTREADAMVGGLLARVFRRDLRCIRRRFAAALEAHHPGARPGDDIAANVRDRHHRVVKRGGDVDDAALDVLLDLLACLG